jgi:hypothetical protein
LARFADTLPEAAQTSHLDALYAHFVKFCSTYTVHDWKILFGIFVPEQFIPKLMEHFQRQATATQGLCQPSAKTFKISRETMRSELLQRQSYLAEGYHDVVIEVSAADSVLGWQLDTFLKARAPTYLRRLIDQYQLSCFVPYSGSDAVPNTLRFALPPSADIHHTIAKCFADFWTELAVYTVAGATVRATINGKSFHSLEDVSQLIMKDLDPVILEKLEAFRLNPSEQNISLPGLTAAQRSSVHSYAEYHHLSHKSEGVGASRHILLQKLASQ